VINASLLGWKRLQRTNIVAYLSTASVTTKTSFITLTPGCAPRPAWTPTMKSRNKGTKKYCLGNIKCCDNDFVSQSNGKTSELRAHQEKSSDEHLYFNALWVKVMRTLVSPELVWTSYNGTVSLCCVLWYVTSLSLCNISSFKRSWELLTGVSTCL